MRQPMRHTTSRSTPGTAWVPLEAWRALIARHVEHSADGLRLRGRLLVFARVAWVGLAALTIGLFIASLLVSLAEIQVLCPTVSCATAHLTPNEARTLYQLGLTLRFYLLHGLVLDVLVAAGYAVVAVIIFWRKSEDVMGLLVALTLLTFGVATFPNVITALPRAYPVFWLPVSLVSFLGSVGIVIFFLTFPDGRFVPRWTRWVALVWTVLQVPTYFFRGSPLDLRNGSLVPGAVVWSGFLGVVLYAEIHRYRRVATATQREQTRWVVFGITAALLALLIADWMQEVWIPAPTRVSASALGMALVVDTIARVCFLLIPITIAIAILRHRLFNIDLIIKRTLVYSVLTLSLALIYEGGVLLLQGLLVRLTGQTSFIANVAASFVSGALAQPLHHRIRYTIDRVFYPRRFEAERTVEAFSRKLRRDLDVETMPERMEEIVEETVAHAHASFQRSLRQSPQPHGIHAQRAMAPSADQPPSTS